MSVTINLAAGWPTHKKHNPNQFPHAHAAGSSTNGHRFEFILIVTGNHTCIRFQTRSDC